MKIAVINETSSADRNADIIAALEGRDHLVLNCGMRKGGEKPELSYIHTGFLSALLLNLGRADFVVGGCGTGQGYLNAVLRYPGVVCGLMREPLDAFLFSRINAGNCVSLALNQGWGWASDINLRQIFDALFVAEQGSGYPAHRREPQAASRLLIGEIDSVVHYPMADIMAALPETVLVPAFEYPGIRELIFSEPIENKALEEALSLRYKR